MRIRDVKLGSSDEFSDPVFTTDKRLPVPSVPARRDRSTLFPALVAGLVLLVMLGVNWLTALVVQNGLGCLTARLFGYPSRSYHGF